MLTRFACILSEAAVSAPDASPGTGLNRQEDASIGSPPDHYDRPSQPVRDPLQPSTSRRPPTGRVHERRSRPTSLFARTEHRFGQTTASMRRLWRRDGATPVARLGRGKIARGSRVTPITEMMQRFLPTSRYAERLASGQTAGRVLSLRLVSGVVRPASWEGRRLQMGFPNSGGFVHVSVQYHRDASSALAGLLQPLWRR